MPALFDCFGVVRDSVNEYVWGVFVVSIEHPTHCIHRLCDMMFRYVRHRWASGEHGCAVVRPLVAPFLLFAPLFITYSTHMVDLSVDKPISEVAYVFLVLDVLDIEEG